MAATCWKLKAITIQGFRGYRTPKTITVNAPCIVFSGPQGSGKSSTVTAIEWCLFGDEIAKKGIGIDERRNWEIRNNNVEEARVELLLEKEQDFLKVVRSDKKKKGDSGFSYTFNGQTDTHEGRFRALLGIQPKDYFSSVHLHQEIIRTLLIEEPGSRKDSLDRLLGLSDLRNLLDGIKSAKVSDAVKEAELQFNQIEVSLNVAVTMKTQDIEREKTDGLQLGLTPFDFSQKGGEQYATLVQIELDTFAEQCGLSKFPLGEMPPVLQVFLTAAKQALNTLRGERPDLTEQKTLLEKQAQLQKYIQAITDLNAEIQNLTQEINQIFTTDGNLASIQMKIQHQSSQLTEVKVSRNQVNRRAGVVAEAIKYFDTLSSVPAQQSCPVCLQPIAELGQVREQLQQFQTVFVQELAPITQGITQREQEIDRLKDVEKRIGVLERQVVERTDRLTKKMDEIKNTFKFEIKANEDPKVILNNELETVIANLAKQDSIVRERNQPLNKIEIDLSKLTKIFKVLELENIRNNLLQIQATEEFQAVLQTKLDLATFSADIDLITQAIDTVRLRTAQNKLAAAKDRITRKFQGLANRSDYPVIEIDPEKYEIFAVSGTRKMQALSIFNQGDLNCAGISIFLGLGESAELSHQLGFIILDDPSQSLDSEHKTNLVTILNALPEDKQVFISTSEPELIELIRSRITRKKQVYQFTPWTPDIGAQPNEG